jgi:hypothetical protein
MQTLNNFFNTQPESLDWAADMKGKEGFTQAKPLIEQELAGIELPPAFYEVLILKLCEALDLEIGNLLVAGYRKHREIVSYRDRGAPPEGFYTVTLLEHSLTSTHRPTVQPVFNQVPLAKLAFDVTLKLTLKGGKLFIRDGMIAKMTTGEVLGSGKIEFEGISLIEKQTAAYDLPGSIPFEPPIPI